MEESTQALTMTTGTSLLLALAATAVLATLHLLAPRIRKLPFVPESVTGSFAGGLSVAYVFLHLLPELAEGNERLRELFAEVEDRPALLELGIFLVALAGFTVFYALARVAQRRGRRPDGAAVFWVHLGSFVVYNVLITYSLPLTFRTGVGFAVLFTLAMGLHFVLTDRGLEEHYGERFDRWTPRLVLAGALVLGWALAVVAAPTATVVVSLLTGFLSGSILLNVFRQEIPDSTSSSLPWFLTGLGLYAALLAALTVFAHGG